MLIKNIGLFINTLIIIDDYALLLKIELTEGKIYLRIGFCRTFLSYLTLVQSQSSTVFITLPVCGRNETKKLLTTDFQTGYIRSTSRCVTLIILSLGGQGD
jgi:hypothetical protein